MAQSQRRKTEREDARRIVQRAERPSEIKDKVFAFGRSGACIFGDSTCRRAYQFQVPLYTIWRLVFGNYEVEGLNQKQTETYRSTL